MSKREIALLVLGFVLVILTLLPDPPGTLGKIPVEFPFISREIRGNHWKVVMYCPGTYLDGNEFLGRPSSKMVGWSSMLAEVVIWDECVSGNTPLMYFEQLTLRQESVWRPSNTQLLSLGVYIASPNYILIGILGRFGMLSYTTLEVWSAQDVTFISWSDSPFCEEANSCKLNLTQRWAVKHSVEQMAALLLLAILLLVVIGYFRLDRT